MFKHAIICLAGIIVYTGLNASFGAELHDPTRPGDLPLAPQSAVAGIEISYHLSAIFTSGSARHAIINGRLVSVGQSLADGARVIKIQSHSVLISQNGVLNKLVLVHSVKQPVIKN